ncbi:hypothetical protein C9374_003331 [Naegleria lovaniensis]|uniref:Uncharacterized protein n=1 Tax=Naegleria lovaniensis TaxID=51637 RepID=A0AA88GNR6_NAELO|nr:uncharacterized protein C9374_003331 [Naegleria lovaniensis]KAG2385516.1 hypothetical protein C9374_003331 [Naegleria lovaniensis]
MSKLLAVVIGTAVLVSAAGGWKKLFSSRNVQSAARHIRETKEVFMNELKAPTQGQNPTEKPPSSYNFTNPSEPLATHYDPSSSNNTQQASSQPNNTSSPPTSNTEKKE